MGICGGKEENVMNSDFTSVPIANSSSGSQKSSNSQKNISKGQSNSPEKLSKGNSSKYEKQEGEDLGEVPALTPKQLAAVTRIQRLVRNKSAWKLAEAEREWKVSINIIFECLSIILNFFLACDCRFSAIWTLKTRQIC
jgi:hypothetical protein